MNTNNALIRVVAVATLVVVLTAATNLITGTDGPDNLVGTPGDDAIKGLAGADTMTGLYGNDTYYVENLGDQVVESTGGGTDTVRSTVRFILPPYVEKLILTGARPISGLGNKLANRIVGNSNFNAMDGGPGNDVLLGSTGPDFFVFRSPLNASTNLDELPDFDEDADSIGLVYTAFPTFSWGLTAGASAL